MLVPADAAELEALRMRVLPSADMSGPETWAYFVGVEKLDTNAAAFGGCPEWLPHPVAAVLKDDDLFRAEWERMAKTGEPPMLLSEFVAQNMNGYAEQIPMRHFTSGPESMLRKLSNDSSTRHTVGKANVFVSWALNDNPWVILVALRRLIKERDDLDPKTTFFWLCNYCIAQNAARDADGNAGAEVQRLGEVVRTIGHTVMFLNPWDQAGALARAWVLWELYHTAACGAKFDVLVTAAEERRFIDALGEDSGAVANAFAHIDVRNATAHNPDDLAAIMADVERIGADNLNATVFAQLRGWVVGVARQNAEARADAEGAESMGALRAKMHLAIVLANLGESAEARAMYEEVLAGYTAQLGATHARTLHAKTNLGILLQTMAEGAEQNGERAEAAGLYRAAADAWEPRYGKDDVDVVHCRAKARELSA